MDKASFIGNLPTAASAGHTEGRGEQLMATEFLRRKGAALAAVGMFGLGIILYCLRPGSGYTEIGTLLGFEVWHFAFLDTHAVLSAVQCINMGVDAYLTNPCDHLQRAYTYSPLWMGLTVFSVTEAWLVPVGLAVDCAFLASLFLLPAPRSNAAALVLTLTTVSGATAFALERGNTDLVLFTLVAMTATLLTRSPRARALGYAFAFLAGLLKYYPMVVMAVAARETPRRLITIFVVALGALALFIGVVWTDLLKAFSNIPGGSYSGDMFGSVNVAGLLSVLFEGDSRVRVVAHVSMGIVAVAVAAVLAFRRSTSAALARLTDNEAAFLQVGSLLVLGCFFAAQNIGYRAVHLIICMPGLLALAAVAPEFRFRRAPLAAMLLIWTMAWRRGVETLGHALGGETGRIIGNSLGVVLRESLWWFLVTLLLSIVIAIFSQSPIVRRWLYRAGLGSPLTV